MLLNRLDISFLKSRQKVTCPTYNNSIDDKHFPVPIDGCRHIFGVHCLTSWVTPGPVNRDESLTCRAVMFGGYVRSSNTASSIGSVSSARITLTDVVSWQGSSVSLARALHSTRLLQEQENQHQQQIQRLRQLRQQQLNKQQEQHQQILEEVLLWVAGYVCRTETERLKRQNGEEQRRLQEQKNRLNGQARQQMDTMTSQKESAYNILTSSIIWVVANVCCTSSSCVCSNRQRAKSL